MDLTFLNDFSIPVILGICLCVGYVVKKWAKDVDNKYIPTLLACIGVALNAWMSNWNITPEVILSGLFSGLSATGLYEMFRNLIEKKHD